MHFAYELHPKELEAETPRAGVPAPRALQLCSGRRLCTSSTPSPSVSPRVTGCPASSRQCRLGDVPAPGGSEHHVPIGSVQGFGCWCLRQRPGVWDARPGGSTWGDGVSRAGREMQEAYEVGSSGKELPSAHRGPASGCSALPCTPRLCSAPALALLVPTVRLLTPHRAFGWPCQQPGPQPPWTR